MKRFDMEIQPQRYYMGEGESYDVSPYESTNGEWVQWDDVAELEAERNALLDIVHRFVDSCDHGSPMLWAQRMADLVEPARAVITKSKGTK